MTYTVTNKHGSISGLALWQAERMIVKHRDSVVTDENGKTIVIE